LKRDKTIGTYVPWACDCPICRVLVFPILKRFFPKSSFHKTKLVQVIEGENMSVQETGSREERSDSEIMELRELVESLRDSILELKATITDMSSPFNKMKTLEAPEEEEEEMNVSPISASSKIMPKRIVREKIVSKPTKDKEASPVEENIASPEKLQREEKRVSEKTETNTQTEKKVEGKTPYTKSVEIGRILKMIKIVHALTKTVPEENLRSYLKLLNVLGVIDDKSREIFEMVLDIVENARRTGTSPEDQMIAIYTLASMLGVKDQYLDEEATLLLLEKLGKKESG
jgi:hypothetical protein